MLTQETYFNGFNQVLAACLNDPRHKDGLAKSIKLLKTTRASGATIYLIGNGGSAAIAEHMAIDLTKNAGLKAMAFSGSPLLTTFANDFGYEKIFQKAIETFAKSGDILIAVSSGGTSKNILNGVAAAKQKGMKIITFSGFAKGNPLSVEGDINIWVNSSAFGYVEMAHNLLIHYINDAIIGRAEYMIR